VKDDWDQHWSGMASSATQNPAQAMRRRLVRSLLDVRGAGARILDIGCGQGDTIAELAGYYPHAELAGIDFSRTGVEVASAKVPSARFAQRDLLAPDDPEPAMLGWATHGICSEVLEHVDDPLTLLRNARAYLAPGCRLVVTVPGGPMSAFDRHIGHRRHYTADSLRRLLIEAGFEVARTTGAGFPFFNLYRAVVILRGERLVSDAESGDRSSASGAARAVMGVFRPLLAAPAPNNRLGWQIVGVARKSAPAGAGSSR